MDDLASRNVIFGEAFEDELRVLIRDPEAADKYVAAASAILAGDPSIGVMIEEGPPDIWTLPMSPVDGRTVWLRYSFDDSAVVFLGLRLV
jgi:hypothetical protein